MSVIVVFFVPKKCLVNNIVNSPSKFHLFSDFKKLGRKMA